MEHISLHSLTPETFHERLSSLFERDGGLSIAIEYESDFSNAKKIRDCVNTCCNTLIPLTESWKTRMILMIDELNNNAIEHGSLPGDMNICSIQVTPKDGGYMFDISVTDSGKNQDHKTAEQMEQLRNEHIGKDFQNHHSIRGRGLFLIIADLVDQLYFQDSPEGGLRVGFQKYLEPGAR